MNDFHKFVAVRVVVLGMKYPGANGSRLVGQQIALRGSRDDPNELFGTFASSVAVLMKCCSDNSHFLRDFLGFCRVGFAHESLIGHTDRGGRDLVLQA